MEKEDFVICFDDHLRTEPSFANKSFEIIEKDYVEFNNSSTILFSKIEKQEQSIGLTTDFYYLH